MLCNTPIYGQTCKITRKGTEINNGPIDYIRHLILQNLNRTVRLLLKDL